MSSQANLTEILAVAGALAARCADLRKGEGQPYGPHDAIQLRSAVELRKGSDESTLKINYPERQRDTYDKVAYPDVIFCSV